MDIAILSFYSGINNRGVERWVIDLSENISKMHDVTIFQNSKNINSNKLKTVVTNIKFSKEAKTNNFLKLFFLDYSSIKILYFTLKISWKLIVGPYKIVIPTDGGWESAIVRVICWFTSKKMIIVSHAGIGYDDLNNLWCFPDTFVALSSYAKTWANKMNSFVKTVYIPDGVDINYFRPSITKTKNVNKTVVCVNALTAGKRVDLIINAVARLRDVDLVIVGNGDQEEFLRDLANRKLGTRVKFKSVNFSNMPKIYNSADVLVSASTRHFSFEMVLVEAMACNLPVVANDDPIRKEIVGDAGFLVDPTNEKEFASKISYALSKNWGNLPRDRATKFDWVYVADAYNTLFGKITLNKYE